jgi:glycosyltransferase involved in cell wall biosynthesis
VLVSDSEAIADVWADEFGVRPRYIPYGAVVEGNADRDRIDGLGLQPRGYALAVARLIPENNVDLTLDALELMSERRPAVIVGSANYDCGVETRLRALNDSGRVRWLGHVHDQELLTQLWAHCGVYVHGHSVGGTNPALLQALGAGAPTLALNTLFNREVIVHDEQLYPLDARALARQMDDILSDEGAQRQWAWRGQQTVGARFQWREVCDAYEAALRDAILHASHRSHGGHAGKTMSLVGRPREWRRTLENSISAE